MTIPKKSLLLFILFLLLAITGCKAETFDGQFFPFNIKQSSLSDIKQSGNKSEIAIPQYPEYVEKTYSGSDDLINFTNYTELAEYNPELAASYKPEFFETHNLLLFSYTERSISIQLSVISLVYLEPTLLLKISRTTPEILLWAIQHWGRLIEYQKPKGDIKAVRVEFVEKTN
ncbi:MAG: hypothetical protein PHT03_07260 [Bacilli bacterium]|nr:hypothetical protein [Bacilli bacterium]MDD4388013.1 hypothetical protein [Bacilli bacterium]